MRPCLSLLLLVFISTSLQAADWNQFRGPNADGKTAADLPLEFGEDKNVAWKTPMPGKAWSSPVVWKNQVWLTNALPDGRVPQAPSRVRSAPTGALPKVSAACWIAPSGLVG